MFVYSTTGIHLIPMKVAVTPFPLVIDYSSEAGVSFQLLLQEQMKKQDYYTSLALLQSGVKNTMKYM